MQGKTDQAREGRKIAMIIAGTGVFWIAATFIGAQLDLSIRVRALFDLIAGAGFVFALVLAYRLWRRGQSGKN